MELSFGEQIKIILKRKNMTIQNLAEAYEAYTGTKMTRQNLSQRLKRDNFPEQDMHTLAAILGYQVSVQLTPLSEPQHPLTASITNAAVHPVSAPDIATPSSPKQVITADGSKVDIPNIFRKTPLQGEINPLTGEEYLSNTVRQHPGLAGYVQVYDQATHEWIDVNEDYFWEFQTNKKQILGSDYQEPILI